MHVPCSVMKIILILLAGIHGLIHLIGFAKAFDMVRLPSLSFKSLTSPAVPMTKVFGIFWLLTALLFIYTAFAIAINKQNWGLAGLVAIILSQMLIIFYWKDAKAGTIANILLLLPTLVSIFTMTFQKNTNNESKFLKDNIQPANTKIIAKDDLEKLPPIVQKWLIHTNVLGKPMVRSVELNQQGEMLTKPNGKWMPFKANQIFSVYPPGFVWEARINVIPGVYIYGRDLYKNGHGNMLIKPLAMMTIANAKGKETDQGTRLRYLAEICWFPSAAISPAISWEGLNDSSARATLHMGDSTVSGVYTFNPDGDPIRFEALRYYENKGKYSLEKWLIESTDHKVINGIRIPVKSTVTWQLENGDFTWLKLEINSIQYTYYQP